MSAAIAEAKTDRKIRVVVEQNLGAIQTKWLKVKVNPAS